MVFDDAWKENFSGKEKKNRENTIISQKKFYVADLVTKEKLAACMNGKHGLTMTQSCYHLSRVKCSQGSSLQIKPEHVGDLNLNEIVKSFCTLTFDFS